MRRVFLTLAKDLEQKSESAAADYRRDAEAAFSEHEKSVRAELSESERISTAILDRPEAVLSHEPAHERDAADGQRTAADHVPGVALLIARARPFCGESDTRQLRPSGSRKEHAGYAVERNNWRSRLSTCGDQRRFAAAEG
ncbi:MbeB family mobilization protein [Pantoea stewartii]|uniref:MbeB family mobilization protein n=1 Tax=Pantoea stewartii TaxID=66269 RepID=UPI0025A06C33|nr:MbeB family mobilization protein [Pantoea stewartii]